MDSKKFRRELRQNSTTAEQHMWNLLRNRNFHDVKFRRQHTIGKYIVDFYCIEHELIIELDGEVHNNIGSRMYDEERGEYLTSLGNKIVRFENQRVFNDLNNVIREIEGVLGIDS